MVPKTSYPPTHTNTTPTNPKPIPPSTAFSALTAYLAQTTTKPHLHPDAHLSTTGITFAASSGPTGGLALHHLKRIEAGLLGTNLTAETEEELKLLFADAKGDSAEFEGSSEGKKRKRNEDEVREWAADADAAAGEWQDPEVYAAQQEEVTGDVGARGGEVRQGGEVEVDKVARKAAKKAKKAAEKKEKLKG